MTAYQGGCHCGAVRFEVRLQGPIKGLLDCNCSICTKRGILHHPADDEQFTLMRGSDALQLYQFCLLYTSPSPRDRG